MDNTEIYNVLKEIKAQCKTHKDCEGCICYSDEQGCQVEEQPYDWKLDINTVFKK